MNNILDKQYNKVFISYAKEDIDEALRIFNYLSQRGYDPWLDKNKLLGGQDWDFEIKKALKEADFIILLLSDISVRKRGYIQREYKLALQYCEEKLDSDIFMIPCKINECEVPDNISKRQWIELDKEIDGYASILKSLNQQRQKILNQEILRKAINTPLEYIEIHINRLEDKSPKCDIEITYPQYINTASEDLFLLNSYIQFTALSEYSNIIEMIQINKDSEYYTLSDLNVNYEFELLTSKIISLIFYTDSYVGGCAHPNYKREAHNFTLNPLTRLTIDKIFDYRDDVLTTLYNICNERLIDEAIERLIIKSRSERFIFDNSFVPEWNIFNNFYLEEKSLMIIFNPYDITAYALGHFTVEIGYDELLEIHSDLKSLKELKETLQTNLS